MLIAKGLFINFCIMVTLTQLGGSLVAKQNPRPLRGWNGLSSWITLVAAGWVLLQFPVEFPDSVILAFHGVAPALAGLAGGPGWGLLVGIPLALYRYAIMGGSGALPGAIHILVAGLVAGVLNIARRGVTAPWRHLLWRVPAIFALANLSLLWVPSISRFYLIMTLLHATGLEAVIWVLRVQYKAQRSLQTATDLSLTDPLTGLPNVRALEETVSHLNRSEQDCFLLLDLDHFKQVNDQHGHLIGDEVLRTVAGVLRRETRPGDLVCRYGGEEFAVLLRDCQPDQATDVAERIRRSVAERSVKTDTGTVRVTISGGLITFDPARAFGKQFEEADRRLYQAKESGRNRIVSVGA